MTSKTVNSIRFDHQTNLGSAIDVIRGLRKVRSNHASALLGTRRLEVNFVKGRLDGKGKATVLGDPETLKSVVDSFALTDEDRETWRQKVAQASRSRRLEKRAFKKRPPSSDVKGFGPLSNAIVIRRTQQR